MKKEEKIKQLKEELRHLREYLEDLRFDSEQKSSFIPVAICTTSEVGSIIETNQSFEILSEYDSLEMIGRPLKKFFGEEKTFDNLMKEVKKKRETRAIEISLLIKNKKEIPTRVFCGPRKDKEGSLIGYFFAIIDVAESKNFQEKLEKEVKEKTKELQEKIEELESFYKLAIGRELKMAELKEEIKKLRNEKYDQ